MSQRNPIRQRLLALLVSQRRSKLSPAGPSCSRRETASRQRPPQPRKGRSSPNQVRQERRRLCPPIVRPRWLPNRQPRTRTPQSEGRQAEPGCSTTARKRESIAVAPRTPLVQDLRIEASAARARSFQEVRCGVERIPAIPALADSVRNLPLCGAAEICPSQVLNRFRRTRRLTSGFARRAHHTRLRIL